MDLSNVAIGYSNYKDLKQQRAQKLQNMQIQKEQHVQNMETTDLKQQQMEMQNAEIKRLQNKQVREDLYKALQPAIEDGDLGLLRQVMKDPSTNSVFGDIVDVRQLGSDSRDGEEQADLVFEALGIKNAQDLTPEQKQQILVEADNSDMVVTTDAKGNKEVISINKLAAGTGYYGAKSNREQHLASALAQKGDLKVLYAHALATGDTAGAEKYLAGLNKLQSIQRKYSVGGAASETASAKNAKIMANYLLKKDGISKPTAAQLADKQGEIMYKETMTARTKGVIEDQAAYEAVREPVKSIVQEYSSGKLTPEEALTKMSDPAINKAVMQQASQVAKDPRYKKGLVEFEDKLSTVESFGRFAQYAENANVSKNILTSIFDSIKSRLPVRDSAEWNEQTKKAYAKEIDSTLPEYLKRSTMSAMHKEVTTALIKAMSGLAVTEEEFKRYEEMLKSGSSHDLHATLLAARTFMGSRSTALDDFVGRIKDSYPVYGVKQQLILDKAFGKSGATTFTGNSNSNNNGSKETTPVTRDDVRGILADLIGE